MKRLAQIGLAVLLLVPRPAAADSIAINSGSLQMNPFSGPLVLEGDRGFTFSTGVDAVGGVFQPWQQCTSSPNCLPGFTLDLTGFWSGSDATGTATLDGITYTNVGGSSSLSSMALHFAGTVDLPALAPTAIVTAPFSFDGLFFHPTDMGVVGEQLFGGGTATLLLSQSTAFPDRWSLNSARYDFTPTPEPVTAVLLIAGLAATECVRRRVVKKRSLG